MKYITIFLFVLLAIGGSAFAQSDTSATTAAQGTFPDGTSFNGVSINALQIATGTLIADGGAAEGHIAISLIGPSILGAPPQTIAIEADVSGGSRPAANVAGIFGTRTIDMGNGLPPLTGVPIVATITTTPDHLGTVGLTLGATALPAAPINGGSMTIETLQ